MKIKNTILSLICFLPLSCFGEGQNQSQVIGPFSGLNNTDNSVTIAPEKAQDLLNVDLSLGGKSVKKRSGFGLALTLSNSTSPIHGTYAFFNSAGNHVALIFNDTLMSSSIDGASPSVLFSTGPNGATYQCVDSQGFAYCANTSRNNIIKTDGIVYSVITPAVVGSMITVTPDRLVLSGFLNFPNRVDFSAAGDFTSWTTGVSATSAFNFTITSPGSRITHITYAYNRVLVLKNTSFSYILSGVTAAQWVVKTISPNVGTLDNTSIYDKDIFYFRNQEGHYYAYDGASLSKLSRDIGSSIALSQNRNGNSWTQTTSVDFGVGFSTPIIYADTITTPGSLSLTFPDNFENVFRDGTNGSKDVWRQFYSGNAVGLSSITSNALRLTMYGISGTGRNNIRTNYTFPNFTSGTTYFTILKNINIADASLQTRFYLTISSLATTSSDPDSLGSNFYASFTSTTPGTAYVDKISNQIDGALCTGCSGDLNFPLVIEFYLSTTSYSLTVNGTSINSGSHTWNGSEPYAYLSFRNTSNVSNYADIDQFGVAPQILVFNSVVNNAPNLTSWDSFSVGQTFNGSLQSQDSYIRASTNTIAINSSTPTWTLVANGAVPSISTGTYFQIREVFSTLRSTSNQSMNFFTQAWIEGQASDKTYATYFQDALWWSVTYGTNSTSNNQIFKYDLINNAWLLYDIPVNGFYIKNNSLYFGSSTSGKVFKYGDSTNDNGSAINAFWKSKDFFGDSPFTDDDMTDLSVFFSAVNNSSMTVTYTVSGSSSTSFIVPMSRPSASVGLSNRNLPLGTTGNIFNLKFGNNAADQPFEVYGIQYGIKPKSWKPQ